MLVEGDKILVFGAYGMVGSAICRHFDQNAYTMVKAPRSADLDLRRQDKVEAYLGDTDCKAIILAAAKVGGIKANSDNPHAFLYDNLMIQSNVIQAAFRNEIKNLMFLGSSCIYPKMSQQPIKEEALLTGPLEPTNEAYALAKITGLKLCQFISKNEAYNYITVMPTNLYGPGDNYHPKDSHVIPALIRKMHEAKISDKPEVVLWGSGSPLREFLHVNDLASACEIIWRKNRENSYYNVGSDEEVSIRELAELIKKIVGYTGKVKFDTEYPDGTPKKLLDSSKVKSMDWRPNIRLIEGLTQVYKDILENGFPRE